MLHAMRNMRNSVRSFWEREPVLVLAMFFGFTGISTYLSQNVRIQLAFYRIFFRIVGSGN